MGVSPHFSLPSRLNQLFDGHSERTGCRLDGIVFFGLFQLRSFPGILFGQPHRILSRIQKVVTFLASSGVKVG